MTPSSIADPAAAPERGYGARIFLVAAGLALATTGGAILSAIGTGDLRQAVHGVGLARGADIEAERRQQSATVAKLEDDLRILMDEVATLRSRDAVARLDTRLEDRLARLDLDLTQLTAETAAVRLRDEIVDAAPARDQIGELEGNLAQAAREIGTLRSSFDASVETNRRDIGDIGKRVDRLEHLIGAGDVTSSIGHSPVRRRSAHDLSGWSVQDARRGAATITGHSGTYEVTPGTVVPGIGRIASVRARGNHWVVVTDKGVIVQR